ncbi:flavodoxin domain-containing protein [Mariniblastus fucicola]|uniref:Protoporphyrinogen IX dehydrogenase [menaquinone] n=1 Tax=Mariniblastus fucicola TaxID=980251 RepID=A0A5B9P2Q7_9BACT|nr:flavodoxin domain-containing protein [Mariniblastus fucicola]QEG20434.1 Protoporphyrinogen IX dehydrogenase [menaquinone] [Mariniblastus fucicola]
MSTLIIYSSKYGQTEKIAWRIAKAIGHERDSVKVMNARDALDLESLSAFDHIILGSPIYAHRHSKQIAKFIKRFRDSLETMDTAFFSVSASAAGGEEQKADATTCMDKFLSIAGFEPTRKTIFAGGLPYRRYNWLTRMVMKWIAGRAGGDTDTSQNYEYTDWDHVESFALRCLGAAEHGEAA